MKIINKNAKFFKGVLKAAIAKSPNGDQSVRGSTSVWPPKDTT